MFFFFQLHESKHFLPKKVPIKLTRLFRYSNSSPPSRHQPNQTPTKKKQPTTATRSDSSTLPGGMEKQIFQTNDRRMTSGYALPPPPELDGFKSIFTGLTEKASDFRLAVSLVVWRFFRFGPPGRFPRGFVKTGWVEQTQGRWVLFDFCCDVFF